MRRCSTRMKHNGVLLGRQARDIKVLKGRSRHRRDFPPTRHRFWRDIARLANSSIRRVMRKLQREEHQCHAIELDIDVRLEIRIPMMLAGEFLGADADKIAHSRGENRKFRCHAVLFESLNQAPRGWFSATAPELSTRERAFAQDAKLCLQLGDGCLHLIQVIVRVG